MKKLIYTISLFFLCTVAFADDLTFTITNTVAGFSTGAIDMSVSGGVAPFTYSWSGPGGFTANTEDLSGLATGTYTITVTDQYCGVATTTVFVDASTDVKEIPVGASFFAFPNPAKDQLTIVSDETQNNATVKVFNPEGKALFQKEGVSGNAFVIDLSAFSNGVYFVEVSSGGKTSRKKIVKQ